jgi:tyrosine-protein kinase Etk/Wzc
MVDDGINTSNNNNNNNNPEGEDREINLYAVFFKYMVYWPWFVASVLACCIGMYVFLRYQTPVYNVTSSVLIKEDEKKGANAASGSISHSIVSASTAASSRITSTTRSRS